MALVPYCTFKKGIKSYKLMKQLLAINFITLNVGNQKNSYNLDGLLILSKI